MSVHVTSTVLFIPHFVRYDLLWFVWKKLKVLINVLVYSFLFYRNRLQRSTVIFWWRQVFLSSPVSVIVSLIIKSAKVSVLQNKIFAVAVTETKAKRLKNHLLRCIANDLLLKHFFTSKQENDVLKAWEKIRNNIYAILINIFFYSAGLRHYTSIKLFLCFVIKKRAGERKIRNSNERL